MRWMERIRREEILGKEGRRKKRWEVRKMGRERGRG